MECWADRSRSSLMCPWREYWDLYPSCFPVYFLCHVLSLWSSATTQGSTARPDDRSWTLWNREQNESFLLSTDLSQVLLPWQQSWAQTLGQMCAHNCVLLPCRHTRGWVGNYFLTQCGIHTWRAGGQWTRERCLSPLQFWWVRGCAAHSGGAWEACAEIFSSVFLLILWCPTDGGQAWHCGCFRGPCHPANVHSSAFLKK